MNMGEAREEAKRRWGPFAFVSTSRCHFSPSGQRMKGVGKQIFINSNTTVKEYFGWAETWEEAFAKADKYEKEEGYKHA